MGWAEDAGKDTRVWLGGDALRLVDLARDASSALRLVLSGSYGGGR